jgi:hypothetical protein
MAKTGKDGADVAHHRLPGIADDQAYPASARFQLRQRIRLRDEALHLIGREEGRATETTGIHDVDVSGLVRVHDQTEASLGSPEPALLADHEPSKNAATIDTGRPRVNSAM